MQLSVEIINTGTELLLGYTVNTHGAWLGRKLGELGLRVSRQTTVPDGMAISSVLAEAAARSQIIMVTGGLGPTSDDITREITAELFGLELVREEKAEEIVTAYFQKTHREMPAVNLRQAYVPRGAEILDNPNGTAPGLFLPSLPGRPFLFLLPGPPAELHPMYENEVLPRLIKITREAGLEVPEHIVVKTTEIGESFLTQCVDERLSSLQNLEVGYCAHPGEVDVRLIGSHESVERGRRILRDCLDGSIVNESGLSLEDTLVDTLRRKHLKIAVAESCTGGMIAARITNVPGASQILGYGWVTYANEAKSKELGVDPDILELNGAVSEEVAARMAEGALREASADLSVAVTGIAGPAGGTDDKPVGTVWIAWAVKGGNTITARKFFPGGREQFRKRVTQSALSGLLNLVR